MSDLAKKEEDRIFCIHDIEHCLDVARISYILAFENGISLWCVADNLRIGAALNTVRLCKKVIEMGLY